MNRFSFLAILLALIIVSCSNNKNKQSFSFEDAVLSDSSLLIQPQYAKGFSIKYLKNGVRLLDLQDPQDENELTYHFALVPKGNKTFDIPKDYIQVPVPIDRTICMTLLQLSNFIALEAYDYISGITSTKNLYNKTILSRVKEGKIVKIGQEGNFDAEIIMAANPDVIFISPFKRGGYEVIKETGITLVPHLGYKELEPLAQAEWVKFIAMFIGKEKEANQLFENISTRYNDLKAKASQEKERPVVFSGEMHGGNWYAVGGKSFLAQMFADAGADYVLKDDPSSGGVNIDFEKMYNMAAKADYWRILNSFTGDFTYEALKTSEPRNADFRAFKEKQIIYCNMKQSPYYERSPMEPDVVLKDFVYVFHPELLPDDYQPSFYKILK